MSDEPLAPKPPSSTQSPSPRNHTSLFFKGLAFLTAVVAICTEAAVIMTQYQEAVIGLETAKASALKQRSLADLKTAKADIEAEAAAVAERLKKAEADVAQQKVVIATAEADVAKRLKTAEATRKQFDARTEQVKAKFVLQNLQNEILKAEISAELLRDPIVYLNRYDYYGIATRFPPYVNIRPMKAP